MRVRVGFDGAMLRAPHTGSGQYSAALIGALRVVPDLDLTILSPVPVPAEPGAVVVPPPRICATERVRKVWWEQRGVGAAAKRAGVDLVHIPYFAAPLRADIARIVTIHDVIPLLFPAYAGGRAMRAYLRLASVGARRATQVIADSDCSRRDAIRTLGLDPRRVTAIPLAVGGAFGLARDDDAIAAVRERFGLHGKRVIFNVAGLDVRKNVATLLRAFARVHAACGDDIRLVVGGSAHGNAALYPDPVPLARELGIDDAVIFPGAIPEKDKVALYHLADCYVAPSLYEGFGLTPLEAMACGAPVVAAEASCTPEVVGDAALLVVPDDVAGFAAAIERVLMDADLARELRERGVRRAAHFTWERTASATCAVYQQAVRMREPASRVAGEQPMEVAR